MLFGIFEMGEAALFNLAQMAPIFPMAAGWAL